MADAGMIGAAISGVVSLITAYMTYRVGMKTAENAAPPAAPAAETVQQGESAMNIVRTGVSQYGTDDEKADLAGFERNPERYKDSLSRVLSDLVVRYPVFRQELESFVRQNAVQPPVQGSVNVWGKVIGPTSGFVQGDVQGGTYTINERDEPPG